MKIEKLITILRAVQRKHGNIDIYIDGDPMDSMFLSDPVLEMDWNTKTLLIY